MRVRLGSAATALMLGLWLPAAALAQGSAQITLENKVDRTLDLYVNGQYGCRALAGLTCTTQITSGQVLLEARSNGQTLQSRSATVQAGASPVWTVCFTDPKTGDCK